MERYRLVFIKDKISCEDFARQSGVHVSKIREKTKLFKDPNFLTLQEGKILGKALATIKVIDCKNMQSKIASFKEVLTQTPKNLVISMMGHIDHGKTTIIDQIMKTSVAPQEAGGITQNISLNKIKIKDKEFFLMDTPGHGVFASIRKFIIKNTDLLCLIVAADDGVNKQTEEIIKQSEQVEKILCINKMDKISKDSEKKQKHLEKIYQDLSKFGVVSSEYGGDVLTCQTSAKTGDGLESLRDSILLKSDFMENFADKKQEGWGYILDSYNKKGIGFLTKILLKTGSAQPGDKFLYNGTEGIIKKIFAQGNPVKNCDFNDLIEITGFDEAPVPGKEFIIINDEILRKDYADFLRKKPIVVQEKSELEVNFILHAENANHLLTLESALKSKGKIFSKCAGELTEKDLSNAKTFDCIMVIWGNLATKHMSELNRQQIKFAQDEIIYNLIEKIELILAKPKVTEYKTVAEAKVLKIFNIKNTCIAGCRVLNGSIKKGALCRVLRNNENIFEARISSMKREKDTISEAVTDSECGIIFNKNFDFLPEDKICAIEEI